MPHRRRTGANTKPLAPRRRTARRNGPQFQSRLPAGFSMMTRTPASRHISRRRAVARAQRMPSTATPGPPEAR
eukprot:2255413-Lingulodinium_polyedra.AAC.1